MPDDTGEQVLKRGIFALGAGVAIMTVGGCDVLTSNEEHAFRICEGYTKENLRSPATYTRIKAIADVPQPRENTRNIRTVHLEYDAANAFGTPVRGFEACAFEVDQDGEFPSVSRMKLGASEASLDRTQKELAKLEGKRKPSDLDAFYACCVGGDIRDAAMKNFRNTGEFRLPAVPETKTKP